MIQPPADPANELSLEPEAEPRRLHPASLVLGSLRILPQMLAGGAGYAAIIQREGFARILMFALIAAAFGLVAALLRWWRFRYTVRDDEIVIESGVFHRQRRVIPFVRVQDIAIDRPLIARLLGTAQVRIETGGASSDEGDLEMIALAEAFALRDRLRRFHGTSPTGMEGPHSSTGDVEDEPLLFAMPLSRVLYFGLFNFSLVFLAILFAGLQYLVDFGLFDPEDWISRERAQEARDSVSIAETLAFAGLVLALGLVAGVARTLARDFAFRLRRTGSGFRRSRGLFTLSEVVIPRLRIQVALVQSGFIVRRLGWHGLSFQTLGASRSEGGVQVAAPFARMGEIAPILDEAGFPAPPATVDYRRVPRRALVRWLLPWLLLAAAAAALAPYVDGRIALAAGLLLMCALAAVLRWRKQHWSVGEGALTVRRGFLKRRTWIIPFGKLQSVSLTQGPLQRRLSLATLLVDTAGAVPFPVPEIVDLDSSEASRLYLRLLTLFHRDRARARSAQSSGSALH